MPFTPSIQSLVGANSGGVAIGLDWARNKAFELNNTNLSRYGLLTGLEENFAPLANMGGAGQNGVAAYIGVAAIGNIFISSAGTLFNGSAMYVDGTTLAMINLIGYPPPNFGQGGMVGVTFGATQYCVDKGIGDNVIPTLNRINEISTTTWFAEQDYVHTGGRCCSGPSGTGTAYMLSTPDNGINPTIGPATLSKILFDGAGFVSNTVIGNITMASIDAGWTDQFLVLGVCLDQTDGKLLAVFQGVGGANSHGALAKINPATAAVDWVAHIPNSDGGGPVSAGVTFSYSDIKNQRIGFYTGSPPTATIFNTSDGTIVTQYSTNLAGMQNIDGQCYNDTLGCIVLGLDFNSDPGHPTLLNSTPASWTDGYGVLYVANAILPIGGSGSGGGGTPMRDVRSTSTYNQQLVQSNQIQGAPVSFAEAERWCV